LRTPHAAGGSTLSVVAAENVYGDIVEQIGGAHVSVTSILSDPTPTRTCTNREPATDSRSRPPSS
jgi:hypothetical protein